MGPTGSAQSSLPFVVALGASAGGLEPLEQFFTRVSPNTGMTFVVVQHLSPDFKSLMDDILSRRTTMPVRVAEEGTALQPNTVLLNPPTKLMTLRDGRIRFSDREPSPVIAYPIDHFFRSLAAEAGPRCAAIVLSGTGSDGSRGIADVHRAGGIVIAQEVATASFDGMLHAAIDTGAVDLILPPNEMPDALRVFVDEGRVPARPEANSELGQLGTLLRDAYAIDFAEYKLPTIERRTERRMKACGIAELDAYIARLASAKTYFIRPVSRG